ncbi:MAG: hypothetical protein K5892_04225 [Acholeplasmatales bacterium]|nr:hypothetical protein [Acholeplasmatales bacterium]
MDRRHIIMTMRQEGTLKGMKPCIVYIRQNLGKIYGGPFGNFVMSYKEGRLYFQRLSSFLKRLKTEDDFSFPISMFREYYTINKKTGYILYLYDKETRYLEVLFPTGTRDTLPYADNVFRMLDELVNEGILIDSTIKGENENGKKANKGGTRANKKIRDKKQK